eukprot:TRINITY_DN31120_c0_g1_i1.p4 TRINITY_DN31120_c0_g1~~TRINITY_DN31120_c0_g1_i1.p4  ORF type:complete len:108 (+),score=0.34 TRINITY_DN31120_c0_g1_i1:342-665(+)
MNRAGRLLPRADVVDVDGMGGARGGNLQHVRRLPAADFEIVGHHPCSRLQILFQVRLQTVIGAGEQVDGHHVRGTQVHVEQVIVNDPDLVLQAQFPHARRSQAAKVA